MYCTNVLRNLIYIVVVSLQNIIYKKKMIGFSSKLISLFTKNQRLDVEIQFLMLPTLSVCDAHSILLKKPNLNKFDSLFCFFCSICRAYTQAAALYGYQFLLA